MSQGTSNSPPKSSHRTPLVTNIDSAAKSKPKGHTSTSSRKSNLKKRPESGTKDTGSTTASEKKNIKFSETVKQRSDTIEETTWENKDGSRDTELRRKTDVQELLAKDWKRATNKQKLEGGFKAYRTLFYKLSKKKIEGSGEKVDYYKPNGKCIFDDECTEMSKANLPTINVTEEGLSEKKRLELFDAILKEIDKHYKEYHGKSSNAAHKDMIRKVQGKATDIASEREELRSREEARARAEEELRHYQDERS